MAIPSAPDLPPDHADLLDELATVRAALVATTDGLSDDQAGWTPTASSLCLLGLLKHVVSTQEAWRRFVVEGPSAMRFDLPDGVTWAGFAETAQHTGHAEILRESIDGRTST